MQTIPLLNTDCLLAMASTDEMVLDEHELGFLSSYAPSVFLDRPLVDIIDDPDVRTEVNQQVYDVVVKLDISAARNHDLGRLEALVLEKSAVLNPIFEALGIPGISLDGDVFSALYYLKLRGLEALRLTVPDCRFPDQVRRADHSRFDDERRDLTEIFGSVPMMVYGSALYSNNPHDIDTMVFPTRFCPNTYKRIRGRFDQERSPPLSFVITPRDYVHASAMSEARGNFYGPDSVMINGSITVPQYDSAYQQRLRMFSTAKEYLRLRRAMTAQGIAACEGILPRINSYLKIPKILYLNLTGCRNTHPGIPQTMNLTELPVRDKLLGHLACACMSAYALMKDYSKDLK